MNDERGDRDRVTAILTLAEAATPGEWKVCDFNEGDGHGRPLWGVANDEYHNPTTSDDEPWLAIELHTGIRADAELVAALHNEAPDLLVRLLKALDRESESTRVQGDLQGQFRGTRRLLDACEEQLRKTLGRIEAVNELHYDDGGIYCSHCRFPWPCPTWQALNGGDDR